MSPRTPREGLAAVTFAAALLCLVFTMVSGLAAWNDSPAFDEPEHATAGYSYLVTGEFWMNPFHPPLFKAVSAAGLLLAQAVPPTQQWRTYNKEVSTFAFFHSLGNDPQRLVRAARIPVLLVSGALLFLFFSLLRRETGDTAALISTALIAFCPNFLAHASKVGNDVWASLAAFPVLWLFYRYGQAGGRWLVGFGLGLGVALLIKYSMVLLLGLLPLMLVLPPYSPRALQRRLLDSIIACSLAFSVVLLAYTVWAVPSWYQKMYSQAMLAPQPDLAYRAIHAAEEVPLLRHLAWYATGLACQTRYLRAPHPLPTVYKGDAGHDGHWSYFPSLLLAKLPLGYFALAALAVWGCLHRRPPKLLLWYGGFSVVYFAIACGANLNLGVRHVLPIFPCLFAFTGWGLAQLNKPWLKAIATAAFLWAAVTTAQAFPGYLAYYNQLAGGKEQGARLAADSNYDWGIDLHRLRLWAEQHPHDPLYVSYFGRLLPEAYLGDRVLEVPDHRPEKGWLVISVQYYLLAQISLQKPNVRPYNLSESSLKWLLQLSNPEKVGDSLLVFRLGVQPDAP